MMVAVGPIVRSYVGTALHPHLRATGLALLAAQWVIAGAVGAGVGGALIDQFPIRGVMLAGAVLPPVAAGLVLLVFRGYISDQRRRQSEPDAAPSGPRQSAARVLAITATLVLLIQVGLGGELALLPLLVTNRLQLSAAAAGAAMLAVGLLGGLLLVPGGSASDRWGRRPTMIVGSVLCAGGYVVYALAGNLAVVLAGAALRAVGASLIWPAATAWIAESMPRRRHAFYMGLFGEFENIGVTAGPVVGGLVWSIAGIQAAFYAYTAAALAAAAVAAVAVGRRSRVPAVAAVTP
jgi:MFS family permease